MLPEDQELSYFEVVTPLGIRIRTSLSYWQKIVTFKHPIMAGRNCSANLATTF